MFEMYKYMSRDDRGLTNLLVWIYLYPICNIVGIILFYLPPWWNLVRHARSSAEKHKSSSLLGGTNRLINVLFKYNLINMIYE